MTYQEALSVRNENQHLKGQHYEDHRLLHNDTILELVVTPQDHPFYPEFLQHYLETASYEKASGLVFQKHGDNIIYAVKCVLNEIYDIRNRTQMHILLDLPRVLKNLG
jgi:hypothetical protein